jgi:hypothetical protein
MPVPKKRSLRPPPSWSPRLIQQVDDWLAGCLAQTANSVRVGKLMVKIQDIARHRNQLRYWLNVRGAIRWLRAHLTGRAQGRRKDGGDAATDA